jgi:hypothetical protein
VAMRSVNIVAIMMVIIRCSVSSRISGSRWLLAAFEICGVPGLVSLAPGDATVRIPPLVRARAAERPSFGYELEVIVW